MTDRDRVGLESVVSRRYAVTQQPVLLSDEESEEVEDEGEKPSSKEQSTEKDSRWSSSRDLVVNGSPQHENHKGGHVEDFDVERSRRRGHR